MGTKEEYRYLCYERNGKKQGVLTQVLLLTFVFVNFSVFGDIYWADTPSKRLNTGRKTCPPGGFRVILVLL